MNWQFLIGVLLPVIGAGFVWLIGVARKDPPLYGVIAQAIASVFAYFTGCFAAMILALLWYFPSSDTRASLIAVLALLILALLLTFMAGPLLRRIADLPPVGTEDKPKTTPWQPKQSKLLRPKYSRSR